MSRSASAAAVDFLPFARLTQVSLSPRVRSLLEGAYQTGWHVVDAALELALDDLDRELLQRAERAADPGEQTRCFESLREFRRRRAEFLLGCRDALQRSLLVLIDAKIQIAGRHDAAASGSTAQARTEAQAEDAALAEIAADVEARASGALAALAYRLGVVAASAPIELDVLPFGPQSLFAALHAAARRFDVVAEHRAALLQRIAARLYAEPGQLYEALNRYLIEHRVYAHLQLAPREPAPSTATMPTKAAGEPGQAVPGVPAVAARSPADVAASSAAAPASEPSKAATPGETPPVAPPARTGSEVPLDARFFSSLRELVAGPRRPAQAANPGVEAARPVAGAAELQTVLAMLQSQPSAPVLVGGKWVNRAVGHIKQDVMNLLRSLGDGALPRLGDDDADTLEMIGLLFSQLLAEHRPNSMAHALLSRLQVPMLRVALKDRGFFTRRSHPARALLNVIAETASYWIEDEDADRAVVERLQLAAERVVKEFDGDLGVFERLHDDLTQYIGGLQKKAEVAERRHVEAAKGREKLDLARAAAQETVQQCMAAGPAPAAIRELLENAWADALALSLLRQGINHPKTIERLELASRLLAAFAPGQPLDERRRLLRALQYPLEEGLAAIGFHEGNVASVWDDINRLLDAPHEQAKQAATAAITELIRLKPRLGAETQSIGHAGVATAGVAAADGHRDESSVSASVLQAAQERIRQLPFGTWFEFNAHAASTGVRRKLCWFSPVTGRCLFLNARGAKADERMIDELARDLARGSARVINAASDNVIDRAWRSIMAMLRGAAGASGRDAAVRPD